MQNLLKEVASEGYMYVWGDGQKEIGDNVGPW